MRFTIARKQKLKKECQVSFKKYLNSISKDYEFIKKYSKASNKLCNTTIESLTLLPYSVVKEEIPNLFSEQLFEESIHLVLKHFNNKITLRKVRKQPNNKKLLFILWIRQEYDGINKLEENYLYNPPDSKLLQAGIKELDVLGNVNVIDTLACGDVLKWEKIRKLPYNIVFDKLLKNTIESRINKRLVEINKQSK